MLLSFFLQLVHFEFRTSVLTFTVLSAGIGLFLASVLQPIAQKSPI